MWGYYVLESLHIYVTPTFLLYISDSYRPPRTRDYITPLLPQQTHLCYSLNTSWKERDMD